MRFTVAGTGETFEFSPASLVIAGYTGRDPAAVEKHIQELLREGIQPPASVPAFYKVKPELISADRSIEVPTTQTSGEVEPVLLCRSGAWYVGVGSDHTARDIERISIEASKSACPKPISTEVWPYEEVQKHWDDLIVRSWTRSGGQEVLYQEAPLADMMLPIPDILSAYQKTAGNDPGDLVMYLGTVPLKPGHFLFSDWYAMELQNPVTGRGLRCSYEVTLRRG